MPDYAVGDQVWVHADPDPAPYAPYADSGWGEVVQVHEFPPCSGMPTLYRVAQPGKGTHPFRADRLAPRANGWQL